MLVDIQRQHATMFSIRLGEKIVTKSGKEAPAKLSGQLRVTSPNQHIIDAFTAVYGGTTKPWSEGQWEAYLPTDHLRIMLLPGQSIMQWWELYKGGTCERRCEGNGGNETLSGKACMCPANFEDRPCKPMTRLNFLCPDVNTLGAGSLVTHSKIAAETLPQEVVKAEAALRMGKPVPAVLRAVQHVGKNRQYVVPQVEIVGVSYLGLNEGHTDIDPALQTGGSERELASNGGGTSQPARAELVGGGSITVPAPEPTGKKAPTKPSGAIAPTAPTAMRDTIARQGNAAGLSKDELENLVLDTTGKYLDEAELSVADANEVLAEIQRRK